MSLDFVPEREQVEDALIEGEARPFNPFAPMENEYMSRGYLLPDGCKDLIDAFGLKRAKIPTMLGLIQIPKGQLPPLWSVLKGKIAKIKPMPSAPKEPVLALNPVMGELAIPNEVSVINLAALLAKESHQIIADVRDLGFFVTLNDSLSFEIARDVARKYGFEAKQIT